MKETNQEKSPERPQFYHFLCHAQDSHAHQDGCEAVVISIRMVIRTVVRMVMPTKMADCLDLKILTIVMMLTVVTVSILMTAMTALTVMMLLMV